MEETREDETSSIPGSEYEYSPLEPRHIRILYLHPGAFDDPLTGSLVHKPSKGLQRPKYHAISYVWGPSVFSRSIELNGRPLRITESLYSALRGLREHQPENYHWSRDIRRYSYSTSLGENDVDLDVPLWADAICINQECNEEKNRQVAMMAQIFRRAASVQIWLGDATPSDKLAFWMIQCVADYQSHNITFKNDHRSFVEHHKLWIVYYDAEDQIDTFSFPDVGACFKATAMLSRKSWFHRLWVIQELAVARNAYFRCGQLIVDLTDLLIFARSIHTWGGIELSDAVLRDEEFVESARIFQRLCEVAGQDKRQNMGLLDDRTPAERLCKLLPVITELNTFDQRDIIYATRELVAPGSTQYLLPNYNISLAQLWRNVAAFLLNTVTEPQALPSMQEGSRITQLPSWVPDLGAMNSRCVSKLLQYTREAEYNSAGGQQRRAISYSPCGSKLFVQGHIVSLIDYVLESSSCPRRPLHALGDIKCLEDYFGTLVKWRRTCARFLSDISLLKNKVPLATLLVQGQQFWQECKHEQMRDDLEYPLNCQKVLRTVNIDDAEMFDASDAELLHDIQPFLPDLHGNDTFAHLDTTSVLARISNESIGWVPPNTQRGDFVALIQGAPFPFILRRMGDRHYSIVGDAYIAGIMQGEACPKANDDWITLAII